MPTLTLYNGDCIEIMKDISSNSVDLIICDLPYGCLTTAKGATPFGRNTKGPSNSGCSWDIPIDLEAFWKEVRRIRKSDNSPTIHFCTTKFGFELYASNPNEFRYDLVWDKQRGVSFLSANKMPMRSHEMIYVFSKTGAYYERIDISGNFPAVKAWGKDNTTGVYNFIGRTTEAEEGRRCVKSVIPLMNFGKKDKHPTEKPIALYKWLIERYCPVGGTVLDPTFGSGNSVFTAFSLGRNAIGIEKDEKFYEKAEARLNALPD